MAELQFKLHHDYSTKLEKLQVISNEAEASGQLYQQMETLLEQHENSLQFLQEDKKFKEKTEKVLEGKGSYQDPPKHKISMNSILTSSSEELISRITSLLHARRCFQVPLTYLRDVNQNVLPLFFQMRVPITTSAKKYCNNLGSQVTSSKIILKMQAPLHCSTNADTSISEKSAFTDLLTG